MTRILLAYSHLNADLAASIASDLGRIGIPFDHITDLSGDARGDFAARLHQKEEPVLLLVTDNLLRSAACMSGLYPALQTLAEYRLLLPVVADGKNAQGEPIPTHIDRMVNALQFMNYWQNTWLDLCTQQQEALPEVKAELEPILDATRTVANQVGDLIGTLREAGALEWPQFKHHDFAAFFQKFGLQEWHEQYKQLHTLAPETSPLPVEKQAAPLAEISVVTGLLAPVPTRDMAPHFEMPAEDETDPEPDAEFAEMDTLLSEVEARVDPPALVPEPEPFETEIAEVAEVEATFDNLLSEPAPLPETDVTGMIRDAWFWVNQGHADRGLELFQLALEQYPDHAELREEYEKFRSIEQAKVVEQAASKQQTTTSNEQTTTGNEAKSYDLMGDMAAEKGDYLFAKYCWDRTAELDANFSGIFRKLGLMTYEHLRDYKETALVYLHKALETNPDDAEVLLALGENAHQSGQHDEAAQYYIHATRLVPALRTSDRDRQFLPEPSNLQPAKIKADEVPQNDKMQPAVTDPQALRTDNRPPTTVLTVLITGATSGIGRATAELFAQHGHRLILTGRRADRLSKMNHEFEEKYGVDTLMLPFDVRDQQTVQHIFDSLPDSWQNIDILLNNAGLAKGLAPIHEGELDHWETMIDTNIKGLLYVTRAVAPGMVRRRKGHIINISSSAGKEVYANGAVYSATKFAVEALTRAIRLDLHKYNIRVSQVSPGHVEETEFAITRFDGDAERARIYDDFQPLRASDVADAIYFIATRPPHVNIQDVWMFGTQQASATVIDRSGRGGGG